MHLFTVMEFAELGYPANSQVFAGVSILDLNSAQKLQIPATHTHNLQLHKSRSEQRLQHVQHQPSHQPGWSFGYISAAHLISEEEEEGEKEKRWLRCLSLSCMRYFDPATRQFFRAPAAALTRKCRGKGPPV